MIILWSVDHQPRLAISKGENAQLYASLECEISQRGAFNWEAISTLEWLSVSTFAILHGGAHLIAAREGCEEGDMVLTLVGCGGCSWPRWHQQFDAGQVAHLQITVISHIFIHKPLFQFENVDCFVPMLFRMFQVGSQPKCLLRLRLHLKLQPLR